MKTVQIIALIWRDGEPKLLINDYAHNGLVELTFGSYLKIEKQSQKICRGYYDLEKNIYVKCEKCIEIRNNKYLCCRECEVKEAFGMCKRCKGEQCNTIQKKAINYCNQPHYVYLAYFEFGIIKVGTAAEERRWERILEQGALYSIFIAKTPTGKIARQIEFLVSQMGVVTKVGKSQKMKHLIFISNKESILYMLNKKYDEIIKKIPLYLKQYFIQPQINDFVFLSEDIKKYFLKDSYQLSLFENEKADQYSNYRINNLNSIEGEYIGIIGTVVVTKNKTETVITDIKNFYGWNVVLEIDK